MQISYQGIKGVNYIKLFQKIQLIHRKFSPQKGGICLKATLFANPFFRLRKSSGIKLGELTPFHQYFLWFKRW